MKRFSFRLQRILDLRAASEKARLADFGREQQRLFAEQQKLDLFVGEQITQIAEMRVGRSQPFAVWWQTMESRYLGRIGRVIEFQQQRVHTQTERTEGARGRYLDARRDTHVMENLRDKKREEWNQDVLREEGKVLDEVGSRKRGEGS